MTTPEQPERKLAAELYQVCGVLQAPARVLDYLSAIAQGEQPIGDLLPFLESEAEVVRLRAERDGLLKDMASVHPPTAAYRARADAADQQLASLRGDVETLITNNGGLTIDAEDEVTYVMVRREDFDGLARLLSPEGS